MRNGIVKIVILAIAMAALPCPGQETAKVANQPPKGGDLKFIDVPAPALSRSLLPMPAAQRAAVYLPPAYADSRRRFPVVYYLPGFGDQIFLYTHVPLYQGFQLKEAMDRLIGGGKIRDMIVVIPNGLTPLGGRSMSILRSTAIGMTSSPAILSAISTGTSAPSLRPDQGPCPATRWAASAP